MRVVPIYTVNFWTRARGDGKNGELALSGESEKSTCDDAGGVVAGALAAAVGAAGLAEAGAGRAEARRVGPVGGRRGRGQGRGGAAALLQQRVARNRAGRMHAATHRWLVGHERHTRRRRRNRGEVENRAGAQKVHGAGGTAFGVVSGRLSEWD
jgi:hypothetical protein